MGNGIDPRILQAFGEELGGLEKEARWGNIGRLASRIRHPIQGMKQGWKAMTPSKLLASGGKEGTALQKTLDLRAAQIAAGKQATGIRGAGKKLKGLYAKNLGAGQHLQPIRTGAGPNAAIVSGVNRGKGVKGLAENLSRRGWTGEGRLTKYVPLGGKGQTALWAGMAAPGMYRAATGDTSGGGFLQHSGSGVGWGLGGALTAGLGMPGAVAGMAAGIGGEYLGRKADEAVLGRKLRRNQIAAEQAGRAMAQRSGYGA